MLNMTRLLNFLLMLGCDRCAVKTRERKVIQVNLGVLVSIATILLFTFGFYISGNQGFLLSGLNQLPFVALLPLVLLLNYKGKFFAARWCLMLLLMADTATALMTAQGTSIKIHSYYLLFAIMLVVLFEIREWCSILILMLANLGLFSFFELHGWPSHPDIAQLSTHTLAILQALVICSCIISSCAILLISEMYAERAELVLQHQADTDTLTGLLNRRAFMRQVALQREQPGHWALSLLDLDFFKKINDNFGHDAGDVALIHVSKLLKQALKPQERLARIGGEEFALLLRLDETGTQALQQRGEQLLESLRQQGLEYQSHYLQLTASVGLATLEPGDSASEALKRADKALYQAKINGRNRVELAGAVLQPLKRKSQSL
ncbi:GGDEF domain-containing protein [Shewanella algae]|uniref:GGDEF domain-containing protein n=1 Tax=Shewanella algae TaxID=38313 RepID=UPI000D14EAF0|nr:GGDEF domain-containing protein [Shewanella algae]PST68828.1 hypothetical protein AYI77_01640 [Shewanella algae]